MSIREMRTTPHRLSLNSNWVRLGNNDIVDCKFIISYGVIEILWFELIKDRYVLNARFYDQHNTIRTAINQNFWTADRDTFLDFRITTNDDSKIIELIGKGSDIYFKFIIDSEKLTIVKGKFYIPNNRLVEIFEDGTLKLSDIIFNCNSIKNCTVAIQLGWTIPVKN